MPYTEHTLHKAFLDGGMERWRDGGMDGQPERWIGNGWMVAEWMMDELWMKRCVDGWMDGRIKQAKTLLRLSKRTESSH